MFTPQDLKQMAAKGITPEKATSQIEYFQQGFPYLPIDRAAVVGDGIIVLTPAEIHDFASLYDQTLSRVIKFVPASGAATRMFKELYDYIEQNKDSLEISKVLSNLDKFAFYHDLLKMGIDLKDHKATISRIVSEGLNYGNLPKGLLKFHHYGTDSRTPLEEHLVEGARYANKGHHPVQIHFTVSPEHQQGFEACVVDRIAHYQQSMGVKYEITYSVQKSSTDTIAVNADNTPFREPDGSLLFRPAGHGALLENLNDLDGEIIYIKTIDNVVPDYRKDDTILYKRALGGMALKLQAQIFKYIADIDNDRADKETIRTFLAQELGTRTSASSDLRALLDRPLRVCGMVKNQGEPGGGPFWVQSADGSQSIQIAESSQISPEQRPLMQAATHFNPVDLVCAVKNYKGQKFDLTKYTDPSTGFISEKSRNGRSLRAQELPGLWNGAMANWNTAFVEVPITTFAPVKTLVDLLRDEHQPQVH